MQQASKGRLVCYASGNGALHFTWCWGDTANSERVTLGEVERYLETAAAKHLRENGWRPAYINQHWCLIADIKRTGEDTVTVRGKEYRYRLLSDRVESPGSYHQIIVTTEDHGHTFEVKHLSTVCSILHFLQHEDRIKQSDLQVRGARQFRKGYRYCVRFENDHITPIFVKTADAAAKLIRNNYPDEKNWRGYPIDREGFEVIRFREESHA